MRFIFFSCFPFSKIELKNKIKENQEKQALKSCLDELITLFHDSKELSLSNGTTVSVILLNEKKQKVWIENIGDSTCVLYRRSKDPLILTEMHQLSNPLEFERVKQSGAKIDDRYIIHPDDEGLEWPKVIQLTRTVGDLEFSSRAGIIHQPFETEVDIVSDDQYLVLASDGLWDLISPKDLMGLLDGSPQDCLNKIQEAIENNFEYIPDDIGLVIKKLN